MRYGIEYLAGTGDLRASVRFGARELDHLGPLVCFRSDELAEVRGRTHERRSAQAVEARLHLWIGKPRVDFLVEPIDDLRRCILGCANAKICARLVARYA